VDVDDPSPSRSRVIGRPGPSHNRDPDAGHDSAVPGLRQPPAICAARHTIPQKRLRVDQHLAVPGLVVVAQLPEHGPPVLQDIRYVADPRLTNPDFVHLTMITVPPDGSAGFPNPGTGRIVTSIQ